MKELPNAQKDTRPWGNFERFTLNEISTVKIITVNPNQSLSLQRHKQREEYWKIISGNGYATVQGEKMPITAGDSVFVPKMGEHRVESGDATLVFLEIAFGTFDENDIERLEDKYGRT
jgi:mannose-1-phosphate guanylyltransferase/mannose-1-phosphate guanylyltransferase/mannose-6-phosphate isomerase